MAQRSSQKASRTTTDHETIRSWAEERGGTPAEVASTGDGQTGIIRIDFPGWSGERTLRPISWDQWFRKFDDARLAFVYEERTARGERSNFNKLVGRETSTARARGKRTSRRRAGARREASPRAAARTAGREAGRSRTSRERAPGRRKKASRASPRSRSASRTGARSRSRPRSRRTR